MDNESLFFLIFNLNDEFPILDNLMIFGATYLIYITFLLSLFLGFKGRISEKKAFLLILLGLPVAVLLIKGIHLFFYESRPFITFNFSPKVLVEADSSFPSRHATISAVFAFAFTFLKSKWSLLFLPIMLWIGFSRIYVGVHYPLDILGGFIVAIISLALALIIKKFLEKRFLRV